MTDELGPLQPSPFDGVGRSGRSKPMVLTLVLVTIAVLAAAVTGAVVLRNRHDGKDPVAVLRSAGSSAAAQHSMRAKLGFTISGAGIDVSSKGEFVADSAKHLSSGTLQLPGVGTIESRSIGGFSYVHLPNGKADAAGHHWLSSPAIGGAAAFGAQDPLSFLQVIGDPQKVETRGDEKVNGFRTTHYRVQVDPARLGAAVAKSNSGFTLTAGVLEQLKDAVADVWIDDNDLTRKLGMTVAIQQVKAAFTFDFFDYGRPVQVQAPAASDVLALSSAQEVGQALARIGKG